MNKKREPTYQELVAFAKWTQTFQEDAARIMRENQLVIDEYKERP